MNFYFPRPSRTRGNSPRNNLNPAPVPSLSTGGANVLASPDRSSNFGLRTSNFALSLRPYQREAFENHTNGIEVWLWGRQTGKSFTLAAWAVERLLRNPGRLVTILSNSRANGMELNLKCAEICRLLSSPTLTPPPLECAGMTALSGGETRLATASETAFVVQPLGCPRVPSPPESREPLPTGGANDPVSPDSIQNFALRNSDFELADLSSDLRFETMNYETRITINGRTGRIKVLPCNPRTARGFSGDLILDEFAFHENSVAIWEAAEPILSANPDFLCRIASTPNGRHNMFYRLTTDPKIPLRKIARSEAWRQGLRIYHPISRAQISPDEARDLALDKRAYDQNYECVFENENMALLTTELIAAAERENVGVICDQDWSQHALAFLCNPNLTPNPPFPPVQNSSSTPAGGANVPVSPDSSLARLAPRPSYLYIGVDVGRNHDLTVITVLEKDNHALIVRAILRLRDMRLPAQQHRLATICRFPNFRAAHIDMTGLGLGLYEYTQQQFGPRIRGINFASSLPLSTHSSSHFSPQTSHLVKAPEALAIQLLRAYEDGRIQQPIDQQLRDDLRKPERITNPSGGVSIAATRDESGHADHFWSLALAVNAAGSGPAPYLHVVARERNTWGVSVVPRRRIQRIPRRYLI